MTNNPIAAASAAHQRDFSRLCRLLLLAKGSLATARMLEQGRQSSILQTVLAKADPGAIGGSFPTAWGDQLADYRLLADAFLLTLRNSGVFDRMLPSMKRMGFRTQMAVSTYAVVGGEVGEGGLKPVTDMEFGAEALEVEKTAVIAAFSDDLLRLSPVAEATIEGELRNALIAGTDKQFIDKLIAATTPAASTGEVLYDLSVLLGAVNTGGDSQLFFVVGPDAAKNLSVQPGVSGTAFPTMSATGGTIANIRTLVSDQLDEGEAVLVDASQIGAIAEGISIAVSNQADLVMSEGVVLSLFQKGLRAIRAERWWNAIPLRSGAVASLTGATYAPDSPA